MTTPKQHWSDPAARQGLVHPDTVRVMAREGADGYRRRVVSPPPLTHGLGADITPVRPVPRRPWWPWALVLAGIVAVVGPLVWGRP